MSASGLLVEHVSHAYPGKGGPHRVLDDVSFTVERGRTLAVVGESGAGKSTLSRLIAGLERPTSGRIEVDGVVPRPRFGRASPVQMVFQQPTEALNRMLSVGASIAEGMGRVPRAERAERVAELLEQVGISPSRSGERPRAFSGGQLQRIVMARALAAEPALLLCDEPTSALDVSVQAQIVNLLLKVQEQARFACVLVTHDLGVARVLADDVLVLRDGAVVELAPADQFFASPSAAYSRQLLELTMEQVLVRPSDAVVTR